MLALAVGLTGAVVWQWGIILDPKMDMALRVMSAISNPFGWVGVVLLAFTGLFTYLYRGLTVVLRFRLARYFGGDVAEATIGYGYCDNREIVGTVNRNLSQLASAVSSGDAIDRWRFWQANNVAWAFGFEVHNLGHYLSGKEGRS
jgi:hypothetical protein